MEESRSNKDEPTQPGLSRYELRWNDHIPYFTSVFQNLCDLNELADVTFACEDGVVCAHKLVLSSCSDYLRILFTRLGTPHPVIFLKNTRASLVKNLLDFVYCGSVSVSNEELSLLLNLGHSLQIQGLSKFKLTRDYTPSSEGAAEGDEIVLELEREEEKLEEQLASSNPPLPGDIGNSPPYSLHHGSEIEHISEKSINSESSDKKDKGKRSLTIQENGILGEKSVKDKETVKQNEQKKNNEILKETPKIKKKHFQNLQNVNVKKMRVSESLVYSSYDLKNSLLYPQKSPGKMKGGYNRYTPTLKIKIGKYYADHGLDEVNNYCEKSLGIKVPLPSLNWMKAAYLKK